MQRITGVLFLCSFLAVAAGCSSRYVTSQPADVVVSDRAPEGGGANIDLDRVADAVPRLEPRSATGNSPYRVYGVRYEPMNEARGFSERGMASWYGTKFHGRKTSSGDIYDMYKMTAAHRTLPLPSYVRVENLNNGRSVIVRVNDRGPFSNDRAIDLSYVAALKLDMVNTGTAPVAITALDPSTTLTAGTVGQPAVVGASSIGQSVDLAPASQNTSTGYSTETIVQGQGGQSGYTTWTQSAPATGVVSQGQIVGQGAEGTTTTYGSGQYGSTVQYGEQGTVVYGQGNATIPSSQPGQEVIQQGSIVTSGLAAGGLIYVQVGAFGDYTNATRMQDRLGRQGFGPVIVMPADTGGRTLYRVRIGPLPSAAVANAELVRVYGAKQGLGLSAASKPRLVYE